MSVVWNVTHQLRVNSNAHHNSTDGCNNTSTRDFGRGEDGRHAYPPKRYVMMSLLFCISVLTVYSMKCTLSTKTTCDGCVFVLLAIPHTSSMEPACVVFGFTLYAPPQTPHKTTPNLSVFGAPHFETKSPDDEVWRMGRSAQAPKRYTIFIYIKCFINFIVDSDLN